MTTIQQQTRATITAIQQRTTRKIAAAQDSVSTAAYNSRAREQASYQRLLDNVSQLHQALHTGELDTQSVYDEDATLWAPPPPPAGANTEVSPPPSPTPSTRSMAASESGAAAAASDPRAAGRRFASRAKRRGTQSKFGYDGDNNSEFPADELPKASSTAAALAAMPTRDLPNGPTFRPTGLRPNADRDSVFGLAFNANDALGDDGLSVATDKLYEIAKAAETDAIALPFWARRSPTHSVADGASAVELQYIDGTNDSATQGSSESGGSTLRVGSRPGSASSTAV